MKNKGEELTFIDSTQEEWQSVYNKGFEEGLRQSTPEKWKQHYRKQVLEEVLELSELGGFGNRVIPAYKVEQKFKALEDEK